MIYSDSEIKDWWSRKSHADREDLLLKMVENSNNPSFAISLTEQYESGKDLSPKQLAAVRKWDR